MVVDDVGEDQRRALEPGCLHQRRKVRADGEIAIAFLPARGGVAGDGFHVDVVGEQIVAAMGFGHGAFEEELALEALADQPALHVREAAEHGIDGAAGDVGAERIQRVGCGHFGSWLSCRQGDAGSAFTVHLTTASFPAFAGMTP
jgi:hypothetical protein